MLEQTMFSTSNFGTNLWTSTPNINFGTNWNVNFGIKGLGVPKLMKFFEICAEVRLSDRCSTRVTSTQTSSSARNVNIANKFG